MALVALGAAAAAVVGAGAYARPLLEPGPGCAAHHACAGLGCALAQDEGHAAHWRVNRRPDRSTCDARLLRTPSGRPVTTGSGSSAEVVVVRLGFDPPREGDEVGVEELVAEVAAAVGRG